MNVCLQCSGKNDVCNVLAKLIGVCSVLAKVMNVCRFLATVMNVCSVLIEIMNDGCSVLMKIISICILLYSRKDNECFYVRSFLAKIMDVCNTIGKEYFNTYALLMNVCIFVVLWQG